MSLWPHQNASIKAATLAIAAGQRSGMIVLPTGAGKTATVLSLGRELDLPMLFLVHRDRLAQQTRAAAKKWWPEASAGLIQRERDEWSGDLFHGAPKLVIASVQTLHQERRLFPIPQNRFGIVVADEAHHAPSASWSRILEWFRPKFLLGVTATPKRLDKKGLDGWFGKEPLYSYSIFQAIADGVLCPVDSRSVETNIDLEAVEAAHGEFRAAQLAKAINLPSRNQKIVEAYQQHAGGRRAIAFCVDVDHCEALAQHFANAWLRAAAVHSKMLDDPDAILDAFAAGKLDVLTSCEVLTEGFDDPGVSCVLMCRPTMSRALYIQMVGRGLRRADGKADCLVIDFTDNHTKHKLAQSQDLFGKKKKFGTAESLEPAEKEKEGDGLQGLDVPVLSWKVKDQCPWPEMPTLDNYVSLFPWDDKPASNGQLKYLASFGVQVGQKLTKGEATWLLDRCKEYESTFPKPATPAQRRCLEQAGLWSNGMSRSQASALITNLKRAEAADVGF